MTLKKLVLVTVWPGCHREEGDLWRLSRVIWLIPLVTSYEDDMFVAFPSILLFFVPMSSFFLNLFRPAPLSYALYTFPPRVVDFYISKSFTVFLCAIFSCEDFLTSHFSYYVTSTFITCGRRIIIDTNLQEGGGGPMWFCPASSSGRHARSR